MEALIEFLARVPSVRVLSHSNAGESLWWVKLSVDIDHPLAWRVVQELGYVLNAVSVEEPLATIFKPVSPPPYLNGGPREFLSWLVEATDPKMDAGLVSRWLAARLPEPVEEMAAWELDAS